MCCNPAILGRLALWMIGLAPRLYTLCEQIVNAVQSLMDEDTLGAIYLGKKNRHPPWEPIALAVMKNVIRLYSPRLPHQKLDYCSFTGSKNLVVVA
jgi:hypothetical protein